MRPSLRLLLPCALAILLATTDGAPLPPGKLEANLLTLGDDKLLAEALYKEPKRMIDDVSPTGAVSVNVRFEKGEATEWFIEQQRGGADLIQAGVVLKNDAMIKQGIQVLNWGFAHESASGEFTGTGDPLHSTSFFVEASARATLLLAQSKLPAYTAQVKEWVPKITAAARWMNSPEISQKGRDKNLAPYTHRFYLRAAALGEAAALTGDKPLADAALAYAREAVTRQLPDGMNPEKDGFDVSYQIVGVTFALRYLTVCQDPSLREKLKAMSRKAIDNGLTKVGLDGTVSLDGSIRTGQEASRSGKAKTLDYKNLLQGLVFAEKVLGEPRYGKAAQQIAAAHKWVAAR